MSRLLWTLRAHLADQRGYTLLELITAMTIFAIVLVIAVGSFVSVSQSSSKASAQRNVQQDVRFNIEEIARQTRAAQIDYRFFRQNGDGLTTSAYCPGLGGQPRTVLPLLYTEADEAGEPVTRQVIYYYDSSVPGDRGLYRYDNPNVTVPTACAALGRERAGNTRTTAENLEVTELQFAISPDQDPTANASALAAKYTHPRVTILATVRTKGTIASQNDRAKSSSATIQTTLSSRSYPVVDTAGQADLSDEPPITRVTAFTRNGSQYTSCSLPNNQNPNYCRGIIPNAVSSLGGGNGSAPFVVTYTADANMAAGQYQLVLTYQNEMFNGLPVPAGYSFQIQIQVSGGPVQNVTLPISPPGNTPRDSAVIPISLPPGQPTITITWTNDQYPNNPPSDPNFTINRLTVSR